MSRVARAATPRPPEVIELAQQKADFTSEGSPPPGRVANAVPARPASRSTRGAPPRRRVK